MTMLTAEPGRKRSQTLCLDANASSYCLRICGMSKRDFNNMLLDAGPSSIRRAMASAISLSGTGGRPNDWPAPEPLVAQAGARDFPIEALPQRVQAAVAEVQQYVKAPLPLVVSSALSAISVTSQAAVNVRRDKELVGPASLFMLTIAESGERKSQVDKMFTREIQRHQDLKAEEGKLLQRDDRARQAAWEAKCAGVKDRIRTAKKNGKPTGQDETELHELERQKPEPRRIFKLMREDATPEGLAKKLQTGWPSAGILSNEAGIVFGAHGMNRESVMRNLSLLNKLWDGGRYQSDRSDDERCRDVRGARLTMGLMVQESVLREFIEASRGLARGSGFMARFLVCWPKSTMGTRFYVSPPEGMPALTAFNARIGEILAYDTPIDESGALTPIPLLMTPAAHAVWVEYHNKVETALGAGNDFHDIADVASKSADNAARLAALFAFFERGHGAAIEEDDINRACIIAFWYLNEALRFLGLFCLPEELTNAARLESWLIEWCGKNGSAIVPRREIQRCGPNRVRDRKALDAALKELGDLGRTREAKNGAKLEVHINPAVLLKREAS
jgi:putative DNA primase/helicase